MRLWRSLLLLVFLGVVWATPNSDTSRDVVVQSISPTSPKSEGRRYETLGGFTFISPVSNARWVRNTTQTIIWTTQIFTSPKVFLEWSLALMQGWVLITPTAVPNTGRFDWAIPTSVSLSTSSPARFQIRVRSEDSQYDETTSTFFMLAEGSAGLTSFVNPVSTSTWYPGQTVTIAWTWVGSIANVRIEYAQISDFSWITIVASVANVGAYNFSVPTNIDPDDDWEVRVTDVSNTNNNIRSDGFSVFQGALIAFVAPVHQSTWLRGNTYPIQWTFGGTVSVVRVEYTSCFTCSWVTIEDALTNTGSLAWTVPVDAQIRDTTIIRLTDRTPGSESQQMSSEMFRVRSGVEGLSPSLSAVALSVAAMVVAWRIQL